MSLPTIVHAVTGSRSLCAVARDLIRAGHDPDTPVSWERNHVPIFTADKPLGWWAERTVEERRSGPKLVRYARRPPDNACAAPLAPSPHPTHPEGVNGAVRAGPPSPRECDDGYRGIVAAIDPVSRIVRCRADLQFIAQQRAGGRRDPWKPISYFVTGAGAARLPEPFRSAALALFGEPRP